MAPVGQSALPPYWRRPPFRDALVQALVLIALGAAALFFMRNASANLAKSSLVFGWDFLWGIASFQLGSNWIGFVAGDPVYKALLVGIVNTLRVSLIAIAFASVLGVLVGIMRLSSNPLAAGLARVYVEVGRNTPLLLQLFFWYAVVTRAFPPPRQGWEPLPGVFLTNRGVAIPVPGPEPLYKVIALTFLLGCVLSLGVAFWARNRRERTGRVPNVAWMHLFLLLGLPGAVFVAGGMPIDLDVPVLRGFNFHGGASATPEFMALLLGLVVYTGSFIAEIVRGGILGVGRGQQEAATALGLTRWQSLRKVILPQAMRLIVPPLGSQYLNIIKNSSLAVAIGYPDIVRVTTIVISETGHAIETIAIMMGIYLVLSLTASGLINLYNRSVMLKA